MSSRVSWLLGCLLLLWCTPSGAQNPVVSLQLRNVTCYEAAAALAKAAGVAIEVPPAAGLERRMSFNWKGVTLAEALRQLCERHQLVLDPRPGGYTLIEPPFFPP